ncbi:MAG TPA: biotin/lipoyl-containing protein [Streptosporangiaceae bacterium]
MERAASRAAGAPGDGADGVSGASGAADADEAQGTNRAADAEGADGAGGAGVVVVRAPLPGTFYWAPRPGAEPFVEVGSRVDEETVVGIVETMKLFNPVHAGTRGQVAEICVGNAEFTPGGGALVRIRADR